MIDSFAMKLPIVKCSLCSKSLPSNPEDLMLLFREGSTTTKKKRNKKSTGKRGKSKKKQMKPVGLYCEIEHIIGAGTALTTPPWRSHVPFWKENVPQVLAI